MMTAKISSKGQVVVPIEIRRRLGIGSGDTVIFAFNDDGSVSMSKAQITVVRANDEPKPPQNP